jgi:hypothetical protein
LLLLLLLLLLHEKNEKSVNRAKEIYFFIVIYN